MDCGEKTYTVQIFFFFFLPCFLCRNIYFLPRSWCFVLFCFVFSSIQKYWKYFLTFKDLNLAWAGNEEKHPSDTQM